MFKKIFVLLFIAVTFPLIFLITPCSAIAIPVDLTAFFTDGPVDIGPDNNDAVLYEDEFGLTLLSNAPFLSDPGISIPPEATTLSMDLVFSTTGSDNFAVTILDPLGGAPFFDFFHDGTIEGPGIFAYNDFTIDLVALDSSGFPILNTIIGLEYVLTSNFNLDTPIDAKLEIKNANINLATPIPEPATILLLASGMAGVGIFGRKKFKKFM